MRVVRAAWFTCLGAFSASCAAIPTVIQSEATPPSTTVGPPSDARENRTFELDIAEQLIGVSSTGEVVTKRGASICVSAERDSDSYCIDLGIAPNLIAHEISDPEWNSDGTQVAVTMEPVSIAIVDLPNRDVAVLGSLDDEWHVTEPVATPNGWGYFEWGPTDSVSDLVIGGETVMSDFTDQNSSPYVRLLGTGSSVVAYATANGVTTIARLDPQHAELDPEVLRVFDGSVSSIAESPTSEAVAVRSNPTTGGVQWHLLTPEDVIQLPFTGAAAAPSPDGTAVIGVLADRPGELMRLDLDSSTLEQVASLDRPPDEIFWPSARELAVRRARTIEFIPL